MVKIICLNDKDKPESIPDSKWIREGEEYTAVRVMYLTLQSVLAVQLNEIEDNTAPYFGWFTISRFGVPVENWEDMQELIRASKEESEMNTNIEI